WTSASVNAVDMNGTGAELTGVPPRIARAPPAGSTRTGAAGADDRPLGVDMLLGLLATAGTSEDNDSRACAAGAAWGGADLRGLPEQIGPGVPYSQGYDRTPSSWGRDRGP